MNRRVSSAELGSFGGLVGIVCVALVSVPCFSNGADTDDGFHASETAAARTAVHFDSAKLPPAIVRGTDRTSVHDWPKYCANYSMTGVASSERSISPATVPTLALLWSATVSGPIASSPTVVDNRVYIGDWSGMEWVLDADTGVAIAHADLGTTSAAQCNPASLGITSAPAVVRGAVYVAGGDDSFYALDAVTLSVLWKTRLGDNSALGGYYGWCSPAVLEGTVLQGIASNCDFPYVAGAVDALDAATGTIRATADLAQTTDPSHFGAGVWSSPAVDVGTGEVFVTTASANNYDDGLSYSVVRLSLANLSIEDHWKITPAQFALTTDSDWGSSPTLFEDSSGRALVGAGQKNGYYYAFLRADLSAGPIWMTQVANTGLCPQCGNGTISTAAFDGKRLYVGGGAPPDFSSVGAVTALDPATGAVVWVAKLPGAVLAPISFANGVVFAAGGKSVYGLDSESGAILWETKAPALVYGGIAISNGRIFFGDLAGNLYCFGIPFP